MKIRRFPFQGADVMPQPTHTFHDTVVVGNFSDIISYLAYYRYDDADRTALESKMQANVRRRFEEKDRLGEYHQPAIEELEQDEDPEPSIDDLVFIYWADYLFPMYPPEEMEGGMEGHFAYVQLVEHFKLALEYDILYYLNDAGIFQPVDQSDEDIIQIPIGPDWTVEPYNDVLNHRLDDDAEDDDDLDDDDDDDDSFMDDSDIDSDIDSELNLTDDSAPYPEDK